MRQKINWAQINASQIPNVKAKEYAHLLDGAEARLYVENGLQKPHA